MNVIKPVMFLNGQWVEIEPIYYDVAEMIKDDGYSFVTPGSVTARTLKRLC